MSFDRRLTPARGDVAAVHLAGQVEAARFVEGRDFQVRVSAAAMRTEPAPDALLETELLFGETIAIYDEKDGWAWGQATLDSHVGYVESGMLGAPPVPASHRVAALRTFGFSKPDFKSVPVLALNFNAKVSAEETQDRFTRIAHGGWVFTGHLAPLAAKTHDWVSAAERFLGAPYLWGGKTNGGVDCSGLVQAALESAGISAPRDTDLQEKALGQVVPMDSENVRLERGDLVFWDGHVGIMLDAARLLHANVFHMQTEVELLHEATARIEAAVGPIRSIKRL